MISGEARTIYSIGDTDVMSDRALLAALPDIDVKEPQVMQAIEQEGL